MSRDGISRRALLGSGLAIGSAASLNAWLPAWAQSVSPGLTAPLPTVSGDDITLRIARQTMTIDGRVMRAVGINGTVPGPLLRLSMEMISKNAAYQHRSSET